MDCTSQLRKMGKRLERVSASLVIKCGAGSTQAYYPEKIADMMIGKGEVGKLDLTGEYECH